MAMEPQQVFQDMTFDQMSTFLQHTTTDMAMNQPKMDFNILSKLLDAIERIKKIKATLTKYINTDIVNKKTLKVLLQVIQTEIKTLASGQIAHPGLPELARAAALLQTILTELSSFDNKDLQMRAIRQQQKEAWLQPDPQQLSISRISSHHSAHSQQSKADPITRISSHQSIKSHSASAHVSYIYPYTPHEKPYKINIYKIRILLIRRHI